MAFLPAGTYALVLLTAHDIYESEDDEFCAGRAYGVSRVAVVQTARYNPVLDMLNGIGGGGKGEEEKTGGHVWPASHCASFIRRLCEEQGIDADGEEEGRNNGARKRKRTPRTGLPIHLALSALTGTASSPDLSRIWTSRIALTTAHEWNHCFGVAHCVYYACTI
jgi:archaemetzincin